jgi:hypothetical protein
MQRPGVITMPDLTTLSHGLDSKATCLAIIETAKGSRNTFSYDPETGLFPLRGLLPEGMLFPFDFGFVPSALGEDGDPLDVLVLMDAPAHSVTTRPCGSTCCLRTRVLDLESAAVRKAAACNVRDDIDNDQDDDNRQASNPAHGRPLSNFAATEVGLTRHASASNVVKAFNHIYPAELATDGQLADSLNRRALAIAGNDPAAKREGTALLERFGLDTVDIGPLSESWRIQRDTPGYESSGCH